LILLNFHSRDNKKSVSDLAKCTAISSKDLNPQIDSLVNAGILKECSGSVPQKYQVNEDFNSEKRKYISLLPSAGQLKEDDQKKLAKIGISEITSESQQANDAGNQLQNKFMETLKYRIDSRIVKTLKMKKKMKMQELIE